MAWLWMACGLAVTLLSFSVNLGVAWLVAAVLLTVLSAILLVRAGALLPR